MTRCESLCGALTELSEALVSAAAAGVPPHSVIHELSGPVGEKKPAKADLAAGLSLTNGPNRCGILISFFYKYYRKESGVYRDTLFMLICRFFMIHILEDKLSEV